MEFRYIIKGAGYMALPVKSELNLDEFTELIMMQSKKLHPKGTDWIWKWGTIEFVNPQVFTPDDFCEYGCALI